MKPYISADIGGSHISSAAVDPGSRKIIPGTNSEVEVDSKAGADEIINHWADCLRGSIEKAGAVKGIGLAMPGPFDYFNGISLIKGVNKFDNLYGVDVRFALKEALGLDENTSVRFINDATAFAIGEAWAGKARGYKKMMAITLGTGFGSAFLDDGIPVLEGESVPETGCVYHLPYKNSIADDYFSTRWFVNTFNERTGASVTGVKDIAVLAADGDTAAVDIFKEFGQNLGDFLHEWIKRFGTQILIIGGNIANAGGLFIPVLNDVLSSNGLTIDIEISELKETAALLGAGHLVDDKYYKKIGPLLKLM